jgi:hypothetical protein
MEQYQKPFTVMGYSFLRANHVDAILQEIMATHWYSQWLPKHALTIRAQMRANLNQNWVGMNDPVALGVFMPMKREISFSLNIDKAVAPEIVNQIIAAFSQAFNTRMMAMLHGAKPDVFEPVAAAPVNESIKRRPLNLLEWERYPIKAMVRAKNH